jgi:hypothetical protein
MQVLYHLGHAPKPLSHGYFFNRVSIYAQAGLECNLLICASLHWWVGRYMHHSQLMVEMESGYFFPQASLEQ